MKRRIVFVIFLINYAIVSAQVTDTNEIKSVVETFFKGFHAQDTTLVKSVLADDVVIQTTSRDKEGKTLFRSESVADLLNSIQSIPDSVVFEEKLTSWAIQIDRTMANAWIGYEFWVNNKFSHCGINSFQMVNFDGSWKIIYIIDTRDKNGCNVE